MFKFKKRLKPVLAVNPKTKKYLEGLPKIYVVGYWAHYGIWEFPFTGEYHTQEDGAEIPLVYQYDDYNGTADVYVLRPITFTTTGRIVTWTRSESTAKMIADALEKNSGFKDVTTEHGDVDVSIAKYIGKMLAGLVDSVEHVPIDIANKYAEKSSGDWTEKALADWKKKIKIMIEGFSSYVNNVPREQYAPNPAFDKAMKLFAKYFKHLWM